MGWSVGIDSNHRWVGYGVPAVCDQPECGAAINRGWAYGCGGGLVGTIDNCGRFFCSDHRTHFKENDEDGGEWVCERCASGDDPFPETPDTVEWLEHLLTDESWQQWRDENSECVRDYRAALDSRAAR